MPRDYRVPAFHDLKSWPIPFMRVRNGTKRFEVRKNDRDFRRGDIVLLREFVPTENIEALFRAHTGICRTLVLDYTGAYSGPFRIGYVEKGEPRAGPRGVTISTPQGPTECYP